MTTVDILSTVVIGYQMEKLVLLEIKKTKASNIYLDLTCLILLQWFTIMKKTIALTLAIIFSIGQLQLSFAYENLSPAWVSNDMGTGRSEVQEGVARDAMPDAIGNGAPLVELLSNLPDRISGSEEESPEGTEAELILSVRNKVSEALQLAISKHLENRNLINAEYEEQAEKTLVNLLNLQQYLRHNLYLFNAIVDDDEDYLVGFRRENETDTFTGLTPQLVNYLHEISTLRLAQYIYHETIPEEGITLDHEVFKEDGRDEHRTVISKLQVPVFGREEVNALKKNIRDFINLPSKKKKEAEEFWEYRSIRRKKLKKLRVLHKAYISANEEHLRHMASVCEATESTRQLIIEAVKDGSFEGKSPFDAYSTFAEECYVELNAGTRDVRLSFPDSSEKLENNQIVNRIIEGLTGEGSKYKELAKPLWEATGHEYWEKAVRLRRKRDKTYTELVAMHESFLSGSWLNPFEHDYLVVAETELYEEPLTMEHFFQTIENVHYGDYDPPEENVVIDVLKAFVSSYSNDIATSIGERLQALSEIQSSPERKAFIFNTFVPLLAKSDGLPYRTRGRIRFFIVSYIYRGTKLGPYYKFDDIVKIPAVEFISTLRHYLDALPGMSVEERLAPSADPGVAEKGLNRLVGENQTLIPIMPAKLIDNIQRLVLVQTKGGLKQRGYLLNVDDASISITIPPDINEIGREQIDSTWLIEDNDQASAEDEVLAPTKEEITEEDKVLEYFKEEIFHIWKMVSKFRYYTGMHLIFNSERRKELKTVEEIEEYLKVGRLSAGFVSELEKPIVRKAENKWMDLLSEVREFQSSGESPDNLVVTKWRKWMEAKTKLEVSYKDSFNGKIMVVSGVINSIDDHFTYPRIWIENHFHGICEHEIIEIVAQETLQETISPTIESDEKQTVEGLFDIENIYNAELFRHNVLQLLQKYSDIDFGIVIDTDIGGIEQAGDIAALWKIIDQLENMTDEKGDKLFPNLRCVRGSASDGTLMTRIKEKLTENPNVVFNTNNLFLVGRQTNIDTNIFDSLKGTAWITGIDDSQAGHKGILPVFESITLSLMAALNVDLERIKSFYDSIANKPITIELLRDMKQNRLFKILPKMTRQTQNLRELYERIRDIYLAA